MSRKRLFIYMIAVWGICDFLWAWLSGTFTTIQIMSFGDTMSGAAAALFLHWLTNKQKVTQ